MPAELVVIGSDNASLSVTLADSGTGQRDPFSPSKERRRPSHDRFEHAPSLAYRQAAHLAPAYKGRLLVYARTLDAPWP